MSPGRWIFIDAPGELAPALPGSNEVCLDLNGSNEYLKNNTEQAIGIADDWSISFWVKLDSTVQSKNVIQLKKDTGTSSSTIHIYAESTFPSTIFPMRVLTTKTDAFTLKRYEFVRPTDSSGFFEFGQWVHGVVTWDGTDLVAYWNGQEADISSTISDNSGSMGDSNRKTWYGHAQGGEEEWEGRIGHMAIWDTVLAESAALQIFNGKFNMNLTINQGNYNSKDNLQHYYRPGAESSDIGADYAPAGDIDVDVDANNISADDIVTDSPT